MPSSHNPSNAAEPVASGDSDEATDLWRAGDRQRALALAFRGERLRMYQIARGIVGVDAAADVAQEAVMRVWSHQDRFDPDRATLARYLRLVTRFAAIDHLRSKVSRQRRELRSLSTDPTTTPDPSQDALDHDVRRRVVDALAAIPAEESVLITQAFYGQMTYQALALHHGLPEGTVKSRIRRGLIRLRYELALDGPAADVEPITD